MKVERIIYYTTTDGLNLARCVDLEYYIVSDVHQVAEQSGKKDANGLPVVSYSYKGGNLSTFLERDRAEKYLAEHSTVPHIHIETRESISDIIPKHLMDSLPDDVMKNLRDREDSKKWKIDYY